MRKSNLFKVILFCLIFCFSFASCGVSDEVPEKSSSTTEVLKEKNTETKQSEAGIEHKEDINKQDETTYIAGLTSEIYRCWASEDGSIKIKVDLFNDNTPRFTVYTVDNTIEWYDGAEHVIDAYLEDNSIVCADEGTWSSVSYKDNALTYQYGDMSYICYPVEEFTEPVFEAKMQSAGEYYRITEKDLKKILDNFFELQAECVFRNTYGDSQSKEAPDSIENMLDYSQTLLLGEGKGLRSVDNRLNIVADYNEVDFSFVTQYASLLQKRMEELPFSEWGTYRWVTAGSELIISNITEGYNYYSSAETIYVVYKPFIRLEFENQMSGKKVTALADYYDSSVACLAECVYAGEGNWVISAMHVADWKPDSEDRKITLNPIVPLDSNGNLRTQVYDGIINAKLVSQENKELNSLLETVDSETLDKVFSAYYNELLPSINDYSMFAFVYVDDDDIPELLHDNMCDGSNTKLLSYKDDTVYVNDVSCRFGGFSYIEKENNFEYISLNGRDEDVDYGYLEDGKLVKTDGSSFDATRAKSICIYSEGENVYSDLNAAYEALVAQ